MGNKESNSIDKDDDCYSEDEDYNNFNIKKNKTNLPEKKINRSIDCLINKNQKYNKNKKTFSFNRKNNRINKIIPSKLNKILQKNKENIIIHGLKFSENYLKNNFSLNFFSYILNNKENIIFNYEKDSNFIYSNLKDKDLINLYNDYKEKVKEENKKIYSNFLRNDQILTRTGRASSSNQNKKMILNDSIKTKTPIQDKLFKKVFDSKSNEKKNNSRKIINNTCINESLNYPNGYIILNKNKNNSIKNTIFKRQHTNSFDKNMKKNITEDKKILIKKIKNHRVQKTIFKSITNKSEIENYKKQEIYKRTNEDKRTDTPQFNSSGVQKYYENKSSKKSYKINTERKDFKNEMKIIENDLESKFSFGDDIN